MATIKQTVGTRTSLTTTALTSLVTGAYALCGTITHNTNQPLDVLLEVTAVPGTVSSNKQLIVFAKASTDGTNFSTGPETGTTNTDESNLFFVGVLPLNTNATSQTKLFSLAAAFGGVLPHTSKIIVKNETGATLNATNGGSVYYSEITTSVV